MTSPAARLYSALHEVACDNDAVRMRPGLAHGDYTSAATLALEDERIFQRSWVCLGHGADIPHPGDYAVEAILDHEVLLIRGDDGAVRAFHNVCRHRGHPVATGCGNARKLTCPYHAWTYASDGSLFYAPHTADVAGFDRAALGLRPIRLETVAGALFVSLDADAPPFEDCYPGLRAEIEAWAPSPEAMELVYESPARHDGNWKASVENFSECYHCGPVHKYLTD
ncbi:MAG: aromatic ring-hydroxylating dioxygenase subunit alpha, partial [Acidimicrobiaceae bacterium]|nr:aromatic ring-hydroxylating dioxygenase subunit alpha [Acidimicrobiaceae bacterium]